jgi:hypothetical protein
MKGPPPPLGVYSGLRKMKKIDDVDLAYIAGFFDGEGSITIHHNAGKSPRGLSPNHTLQVSVANTDPRVIVWLRDCFGGRTVMRPSKVAKWRHVLQWIVRSNAAAEFLKAILPFLRMKREQAEIAIIFQGGKTGYRKKPLSVEAVQAREDQRSAIRVLNAKSHIKLVLKDDA